jgi:hypothetical protein
MATEGRGENPAQIGEAPLHHSIFRAVSRLKSKKGTTNKGKSVTIEILNAHAASSTPNRSLKTLLLFLAVTGREGVSSQANYTRTKLR